GVLEVVLDVVRAGRFGCPIDDLGGLGGDERLSRALGLAARASRGVHWREELRLGQPRTHTPLPVRRARGSSPMAPSRCTKAPAPPRVATLLGRAAGCQTGIRTSDGSASGGAQRPTRPSAAAKSAAIPG